jgi:hypothetical protein
MTLDYFDYKIACLDCGNVGILRYSRDEWNRSEVSSSGFAILYADPRPESSSLRCQQCRSDHVSVANEPSLSC